MEIDFFDFIRVFLRLDVDVVFDVYLFLGDWGLVMFYEVFDVDVVVFEHVYGD